MQRVLRDQLTYEFRADSTPVISVKPGESFVVETYDASTGRIRHADDLAAYLAVRDIRKVNPAGGPIAIDGTASTETLDAIRRFELDNGLPITGEASDALIGRLISIGAIKAT